MSLAESVVKRVLGMAEKPLKAAGACEFTRRASLSRLERIIMSHHDEYGEFNYSACAKEIKQLYIDYADKERTALANAKIKANTNDY